MIIYPYQITKISSISLVVENEFNVFLLFDLIVSTFNRFYFSYICTMIQGSPLDVLFTKNIMSILLFFIFLQIQQ